MKSRILFKLRNFSSIYSIDYPFVCLKWKSIETIRKNLGLVIGIYSNRRASFLYFPLISQLNRTRVDALDLAQKDIKLRQALWETSEEWESSIVVWYEEPFGNINIDNATNLTAKTLKNCTMLEKNFPENTIVGRVRKSAEAFKTKLPVFSHLRNPALKGVSISVSLLSEHFCED